METNDKAVLNAVTANLKTLRTQHNKLIVEHDFLKENYTKLQADNKKLEVSLKESYSTTGLPESEKPKAKNTLSENPIFPAKGSKKPKTTPKAEAVDPNN